MDKKPSKSNVIIKLIDRYPTCTSFYYKYNETKYFIGASPEIILKKENDIINIDALAGSKSVENKNKLLNDNKVIIGANTFYDHQFDESHKRLGLGVEAITSIFDLRGNYYNAMSGRRTNKEGSYTERALDGWDLRTDYHLPIK